MFTVHGVVAVNESAKRSGVHAKVDTEIGDKMIGMIDPHSLHLSKAF